VYCMKHASRGLSAIAELLVLTLVIVTGHAWTPVVDRCRFCLQVLSCANELGLNEVVRECMLYLVQNCNADNAVLHYSIAENNKLPELSESVLQFIFDRFSEIAGGEHFIYIPAERLRTILNDDQLCARNELEIFDVCVFDSVSTPQWQIILLMYFSLHFPVARLPLLPDPSPFTQRSNITMACTTDRLRTKTIALSVVTLFTAIQRNNASLCSHPLTVVNRDELLIHCRREILCRLGQECVLASLPCSPQCHGATMLVICPTSWCL